MAHRAGGRSPARRSMQPRDSQPRCERAAPSNWQSGPRLFVRRSRPTDSSTDQRRYLNRVFACGGNNPHPPRSIVILVAMFAKSFGGMLSTS